MIDMFLAAALTSTLPILLSPPPIVVTQTGQRSILVLKPGNAKCADGDLDLSMIQLPSAQLTWSPNRDGDSPVVFIFRIDERGRASGIKMEGQGSPYVASIDVAPSLAGSQFTKGKARLGCSIIYTPIRSKIADADRNVLIEYSVFAGSRPPKELFDRLSPAGSTCADQRPMLLLRAYPDFQSFPAEPGQRHWSMVQFDIDASGKPQSISTMANSGSQALDKAAIAAVAKSRFGKGAKKGCVYPYWQRGPKLAAVESPNLDAYRKGGETCPADVKWQSKPALVYPESFRRRNIEGWAIVSFDVAPWGDTGNSEIVAAEPAAEFGRAALNLVRNAKVANAGQGFSKCLEKMRFVMGGDSAKADGQTD